MSGCSGTAQPVPTVTVTVTATPTPTASTSASTVTPKSTCEGIEFVLTGVEGTTMSYPQNTADYVARGLADVYLKSGPEGQAILRPVLEAVIKIGEIGPEPDLVRAAEAATAQAKTACAATGAAANF